ncbi:MAG TPA: Stp1/IreP family PP2C-type Ser/Thr phosphatase [Ktedonosporobacter sp.]|nr:Stp1/IreP family PP2C-type Ser/Thr phosphatase [Ktedonosporobacter sp.]
MAVLPSKNVITTSERLYRAMLILYPKPFRQIYTQEMVQTFRDCCREALQDGETWKFIHLWSFVLYDLLITACNERIRSYITLLKRLLGIEKEYTMLDHLINLDFALRTDVGQKRSTNEDNMTSVIPQDPQILAKKGALFVVADGMGGHTKGEVASEMAVSGVSTMYYQQEEEDIPVALIQAIQSANQSICKESEGKSAKDSMGTTCIAAVLRGDTAYIANVGDSRAYIVSQGQVRQISHDHSPVAELLRAGKITKEEARNHPERNVIFRCLGTQSEVEVDVFAEPVQKGDILVLCTDGLSALVEEDELLSIVEQYDPEESVSQLIERANERGGPDNITAVIARIGYAA